MIVDLLLLRKLEILLDLCLYKWGRHVFSPQLLTSLEALCSLTYVVADPELLLRNVVIRLIMRLLQLAQSVQSLGSLILIVESKLCNFLFYTIFGLELVVLTVQAKFWKTLQKLLFEGFSQFVHTDMIISFCQNGVFFSVGFVSIELKRHSLVIKFLRRYIDLLLIFHLGLQLVTLLFVLLHFFPLLFSLFSLAWTPTN